MGSICGEQHKLHLLFLNNKALVRDVIDIPPRKLLHRRPVVPPVGEVFGDSLRADEEALFQKFLPCNNGGDNAGGGGGEGDEDDPYSSDHFRMYEFKVRRCTRSRSHDWTDCPFAHPGEKARRRDPRRYHYSGTVCSEFRRGTCSRGDSCEFAHGVFECWLHPARYRTEACKDGKNCKRKVCFFAHSASQLRVLPPSSESPPANLPSAGRQFSNSNHCCLFCHNVNASPTSTLLGMSHPSPPLSPSLSPPLSPVKGRSLSGLSPVSRYGESCGLTQLNPSPLSYKDVLTELMSSLDSMNLHEASPPGNKNLPWIDVSFSHGDNQNLFVLSPSTPSPSVSRNFFSDGDCSSRSTFNIDDKLNANGASTCPDLGWVNDLLT